MGPLAPADGHDFPRLNDELVPGVAAEGDDIFVGFEDPVGEPVVAHELPDVLHRVQFWGPWRKGQERDVAWDRELVGGVPAGLIEEEDGMGARCDLGRDFAQMPLHGLSVAAGQDEGGTDTAIGTDGTEDVGRLGSLVMGHPGPATPRRPSAGDLVFLPDTSFILPPQLYRDAVGELCSDRVQRGREVFLKSSITSSFCA